MAKKTYNNKEKDEAMLAITTQIMTVGDKDWEAVRRQFKGIPKSTFYRWVKTVKVVAGTDKTSLTASAQIAMEASNSLPAAPSPSYIDKTGSAGKSNLDFLGKLDQLYEDSEKLRMFSVRDDRIVSPKFFAQSINIRRSLLETALKAMSEVWDLRQMQNFYDTVLEEISKESPECAARILDRLQSLNAEIGMTYNMARA